jgi:NAD(P)-dependent dehydrogenase (short-subunit alcohol dehydrogenase family)
VDGINADISTEAGVHRVFAEADRVLGGLDVLVTCAALGAEPIHEMPDDEWRYVIQTNLIGTMACAREAVLRMRQSGGGHIVLVGSIATDIKKPGESVYVASKAGIQAFARTLRKELADYNIKVSEIQPGSVATDMQQCSLEEKRAAVERREMLHAREVAEAIAFVLTRSSRADVVNLRIEPLHQKTH